MLDGHIGSLVYSIHVWILIIRDFGIVPMLKLADGENHVIGTSNLSVWFYGEQAEIIL